MIRMREGIVSSDNTHIGMHEWLSPPYCIPICVFHNIVMVKSMYDRDIDMLRLANLAFTGKCAYSLGEAVHLYCRYDDVAIRGDEIERRDPLDTIGGVGGCAIMPALQLATMCPTHSVLLDTVSPCLGVGIIRDAYNLKVILSILLGEAFHRRYPATAV